jgi:transposase
MHLWTSRAELEHQVITLAKQDVARRAIARALGVSRNTVRKILIAHGVQRREVQTALAAPPARLQRQTKLDAFHQKVAELLLVYPEITAQRVFEELGECGYDGGYTQVKAYVRKVRPKERPAPSLKTPDYGPGEMAENDWSPYAVDFLDGKRRVVQAFSYVLPFSRRKCYFLYEQNDLHALMDGHVKSFDRLGGVARTCKYDSQKPVVLCWEGNQPIYNPRFLAFCAYYEFRPLAVRRRHPNDKPRVERSFWEAEQSFLSGRRFRDLDDMREQLARWMDRICDQRRRTLSQPTPLERFQQEKPHLCALPAHPYDTARVVYRVCSIDGFIAIDGNRYAVPYDHVTDILPVRITQSEVFLYSADLRLVARHELAPRGAGLDLCPPGIHRPPSRRGADLDQLQQTFADLGEEGALFFAGLMSAQPRAAGYHARQILLLRERFRTADLCAAFAHARSFGAFECRAIERILCTRCAPRRLAEYVQEDAVRKLDPAPSSPEAFLHDLDDYDRLPQTSCAQEAPCPAPESPPIHRSSWKNSNDTSSSSA